MSARQPPPLPKSPHPVSKQALGNRTVNVLRPVPRVVFLWLRFKDPEGKERNFPAQLPVRVVLASGKDVKTINAKTLAKGVLRFPLPKSGTKPLPWSFRLEWTSTDSYYIVEQPGAIDCDLATPGTLKQVAKGGRRFFMLPKAFSLLTADWTVAGGSNATVNLDRGTIAQTDIRLDVGSSRQPFRLTLNPHWRFFRFVFFDRYFGPAPSAGESRASHQVRISIPPIELEGFRGDASAVGNSPDTHSNWTVGGDPKKLLQCLPWILQWKDDGGKRKALPKLTGTTAGLRVSTPEGTYIHSKSATDRVIEQIPSGDSRLDLGAGRLRYYDLPALWKSLNYWVRGSHLPAKNERGKFFDELTASELEAAEQAGKPLEFSLDDIVLTGITDVPIPLLDADHVTLFHHSFYKTGGKVSGMGVFDPGSDVSDQGYPYSQDVRAPRRNYIWRYPDWTRLVIAQGNLFDVFDQRTRNTGYVAGARAAVRWVDAVKDEGVPAMKEFSPRPGLTGGAKNDSIAVQPFYELSYFSDDAPPEPGKAKYDLWTSSAAKDRIKIGRVDVALLRCSDHSGDTESAALLRYHRYFLRAEDKPNYLKGKPQEQKAWLKALVTNVADRWSGADGINGDLAWILPRKEPPKLQIQVVTFVQYLEPGRSHVIIATSDDPDVGFVNTIHGYSELCPGDASSPGDAEERQGEGLVAAHEAGHAGGLPDEYSASADGQYNFAYRHAPGTPFLLDGAAMMWRNKEVRARHFWHHAEWLRTTGAFKDVEFTVAHGDKENDFKLPHYRDATLGRNYVYWPVRMNLRARGSGTACFDSHLYLLGNDLYASSVLPGMPGITGSGAFDGILTVLVRMYFLFADSLNEETIRSSLYAKVESIIFQCIPMRVISLECSGPPKLARCLLYLRAQHLSSKKSTAPQEKRDEVAATLKAAPFHVQITITERTAQQAKDIAKHKARALAAAVLPVVRKYRNLGRPLTQREEQQQTAEKRQAKLDAEAQWLPPIPNPTRSGQDDTIRLAVDLPADYANLSNLAQEMERTRFAKTVTYAFIRALGMSPYRNERRFFRDTASYKSIVRSVLKTGEPDPQIA